MVLDLGQVPLADELFPNRESAIKARRFPLQVGHCAACKWAQLLQLPDREVLFGADYPYFSSVSEGVSHSARLHAAELIQTQSLGPEHLVVEIASNDGYQLKWFEQAGIHTFGIDPAPGPAAAARERGVRTLEAFFDAALADQICQTEGQADVILAKNVLAHVSDPGDFLQGIQRLLKPGGIVSFEFPYLANLLSGGQFDTIYHEHASYLAITPLDQLLQRYDLGIVSIRMIDLHGGSLRVDVKQDFVAANPDRQRYLQSETRSGINERAIWTRFAESVKQQALALRTAVEKLQQQGLRLAAYGAAAKGVTLLNVCGLDHRDIEFVVDRNPYKWGKFLAGTGIEVKPVEELLHSKPDVALLLAWNFTAEIRAQQTEYESKGGRFLIPIPWPLLTRDL
jgi:SAM-dependent methyltransferase